MAKKVRWPVLSAAPFPGTPPAQALPAAFPLLHDMMAEHSSAFRKLLRAEEALISDILSEVGAKLP